MNREVFLSILAMDSYQRGYAPGIKNISGSKIGNATIGTSSEDELGPVAEAEGFYALSYTLDQDWAGLVDGTTVLSFRGTDFDAGIQLWRDFINGWSSFSGFGSPSQFSLALNFYDAVTGIEFRGQHT